MTDNRLGFTFYRFFGGKTIASTSYSLFVIFLMWSIVDIYKSVFLAGVVPIIYLLVDLVTAAPVGHAIDRVNNSVLSVLSTIIMAIGFLVFSRGLSLFTIYISTAIVAFGNTLNGDSFTALLKKLVSPEGVTKATALNSASLSVSSLVGVALGGISLIFLSHYAALMLFLMAVISTILSVPIKLHSVPEETDENGKKSGYKQVFSFFRKILGFIMLALVINGFFISMTVYGSGLFNLYLHTSPAYYTLFEGAFPALMIAGSYFVNKYQNRFDHASTIALMLLLFAPVLMILGISRTPIIDIIASGFLGFIIPLVNVPLQSRLIKFTPVPIFGRVMAFLRIFVMGATPVMASIFSFLSLYFEVTNILLAMGILMVPFSFLGFGVLRNFYSKTEQVEAVA